MNGDMASIRERLQHTRQSLSMSYQDLSDKTGISKSSLQRYETGHIGSIGLDKLEILAQALRVSPAYLMGWDDTPNEIAIPPAQTKQVPLLGRVAAGTPIGAHENIEEWLTVDEREKVDFALTVQGDSMTAVGIYPGDIIYIRQQPTVNNGEIAVVMVDDGFPDSAETTVKRFYQYGKNVSLLSESHNPANKDIEIVLGKGTNVTVLGKVIFLKANIENR